MSIRLFRDRRAQTMGFIRLIELVLSIMLIAFIAIGVQSMINGNTFLQQYYAKDNAMLIESLHAVPNGVVSYGYLWTSKGFTFTVEPRLVTVGPTANGDKDLTITKAFGRSYDGTRGISLTLVSFVPHYYEYLVSSTSGTITISQRFQQARCPDGGDLPNVVVKTPQRVTQVDRKVYNDQKELADIETLAASALKSRIDTRSVPAKDSSGVDIGVVAAFGRQREVSVYVRNSKALTQRLACIIERSTKDPAVTVTELPYATAGVDERQAEGDVIIRIQGSKDDIPKTASLVGDAILTYWTETAPDPTTNADTPKASGSTP